MIINPLKNLVTLNELNFTPYLAGSLLFMVWNVSIAIMLKHALWILRNCLNVLCKGLPPLHWS